MKVRNRELCFWRFNFFLFSIRMELVDELGPPFQVEGEERFNWIEPFLV